MIFIRLKETEPTRAQDAEQNYVDPEWFKVVIPSQLSSIHIRQTKINTNFTSFCRVPLR